MKKSIFLIGICLMFVFTSSNTVSYGKGQLLDDTIYVDDDNTNGPWDGSIDNPYNTIQEAVYNAVDDDEIFVFNGFYQENIQVDVEVNLIGEDNNNTIVDGGGTDNVFNISTDGVEISNFRIQNSGKKNKNQQSYEGNGGIKIIANQAIIENNIIEENKGHGIVLSYLDFNDYIYGSYIRNNVIKNNGQEGILAYIVNGIFIISNIIEGNDNGIRFGGSYSSDIFGWTIKNNRIINNNDYGIFTSSPTTKCKIFNNIIEDHDDKGIYINGYDNEIYENHIESSRCGIYINKRWSYDANHIHHNNFITCFEKGDFHYFIWDDFIEARFDKWEENYWGMGRSIPKCIDGVIQIYGRDIKLPCFLFDMHPANAPYDINPI